jgi:hypothetical protein
MAHAGGGGHPVCWHAWRRRHAWRRQQRQPHGSHGSHGSHLPAGDCAGRGCRHPQPSKPRAEHVCCAAAWGLRRAAGGVPGCRGQGGHAASCCVTRRRRPRWGLGVHSHTCDRCAEAVAACMPDGCWLLSWRDTWRATRLTRHTLRRHDPADNRRRLQLGPAATHAGRRAAARPAPRRRRRITQHGLCAADQLQPPLGRASLARADSARGQAHAHSSSGPEPARACCCCRSARWSPAAPGTSGRGPNGAGCRRCCWQRRQRQRWRWLGAVPDAGRQRQRRRQRSRRPASAGVWLWQPHVCGRGQPRQQRRRRRCRRRGQRQQHEPAGAGRRLWWRGRRHACQPVCGGAEHADDNAAAAHGSLLPAAV